MRAFWYFVLFCCVANCVVGLVQHDIPEALGWFSASCFLTAGLTGGVVRRGD